MGHGFRADTDESTDSNAFWNGVKAFIDECSDLRHPNQSLSLWTERPKTSHVMRWQRFS